MTHSAKILILASAILCCGHSLAFAESVGNKGLSSVSTLKSPDGKLSMRFGIDTKGTPTYSLDYGSKHIILPSSMGYELRGVLKAQKLVYGEESIEKVDKEPCWSFYDGFSVESKDSTSFDETWSPVWGEESEIRNHYNELSINLLQKSSDKRMTIRFRLYDDGLGFRYEFPEQKKMTYFVIKDELTQFAMAEDYSAFWIAGDYDTQEYEYTKSKLSEISGLIEKAISRNDSQTPFSKTGVQTSLQMKSLR